MTDPLFDHVRDEADTSDCPKCGEWRDAPDASCPNCGYAGHDEHRVDEVWDRGGAMDAVCLDCGANVWRQGYGSFVGPWVAS